jgi:prepilin-type processing-associated H-X9-DG protein
MRTKQLALPAAAVAVTAVCSVFTVGLVNPAFADGHASKPQASASAPKADAAGTSAKQFYIRGVQAADQKQWADAEEYYNEALRLNPNYGEALGNRGAARFNLKNYNGALSDYNAALKIFPTNKALIDLKTQVEGVMNSEQANAQQENAERANAAANQIRIRSVLGGDFADPSTQIMMNAQRRGLVPADPSDPATIIMENARRRGLIPANTPNP